jgi:hypothetical protein
MTTTEKQKIYDNIYQYIIKGLDDWMDDQIFKKPSMKELGKLYYNHILNEVEDADSNLLNKVIKNIKSWNVEYTTQEDYYLALCEILCFKKIPSEVWNDVEREYNKVFIQKYSTVMRKYQVEINKIDKELTQTKTDVDAIKNTKFSCSFIRDISSDEQKLYELCSKCNSLRTRKEMLMFVINYVTSKLSDFCDMQDIQSVKKAKKQETLKLSKEDNYGVDLSFLAYMHYLDIVEDDLDRPYALFFKVKIYIILENAKKQYFGYEKLDDTAIEKYKQYIQQIPKIDDLQLYKNSNLIKYNAALEKLICDYKLLEELQDNLKSSVCLRERKNVLLKAVKLYNQGEYELFNNILPIQIEGMFADYLKDTTTFLRFSKMNMYFNAVLKDKIRYLQEVNSDIYPEAIEYFMYYFNNMIRNKIAHGKYKGNLDETIQDEIFAKELILDMGMLVYMLSRKSETEKMYRFIHEYKKYYENIIFSSKEHQCFDALFNDMIGNKIIMDYDILERYRPIQVTYWLVNPYYEKIYEQVGDKKDLLELRDKFLSKEFWEYVLQKLNDVINRGYDYLRINMEFLSIVKGLFRCNVSIDVKRILGKVNSALLKIKDMQQKQD